MNDSTKPICGATTADNTGEALCESIAIQKDVTKGSVSRAVSPAISLSNGREQPKTETLSNQSGSQSRSQKPDCYKCAFRGEIPGNAHSKCMHPYIMLLVDENPLFEMLSMLGSRGLGDLSKEFSVLYKLLNINGDEHGKKSGWFNWPINYDPVWLNSCDGFKEKT